MAQIKIYFTAKKKRNSGSSISSRISTNSLRNILERLKNQQNQNSTNSTYFRIWRQFNNFIIRLDTKPSSWEERVTLFVAELIDRGLQSQSIKTYVSGIKRILSNDGYIWDENKLLLGSLFRATKLINDSVKTRLPIQHGLLELILFELERVYGLKSQYYLELLYKAIFVLGYYGLMRAGELMKTDAADHTIKARNIHIASNKEKLLIILYSSKTHNKINIPQKIKITSNTQESFTNCQRHFCPFTVIRQYIAQRGTKICTSDENFFVFKDKSPVTASGTRIVLQTILKNLGLNETLYGLHSFRIGRCTDLMKYNYSISEIKRMARLRSNVVFKYMRQ